MYKNNRQFTTKYVYFVESSTNYSALRQQQRVTKLWLFHDHNQQFSPFYFVDSDIYSVSQEECARLREGVPYVKLYRYNPKHLCPKFNGYGDNGQRKVCSSDGSTHCTCQLTALSMLCH